MGSEAVTTRNRPSASSFTLIKAALRNSFTKSGPEPAGKEGSKTKKIRTLVKRKSKLGFFRHPAYQLSPIAKLPVELLEEIFVEALLSSHVSHQEYYCISLVCKTWSAVVFPYPLIRVNANGQEGVAEAVQRIRYLELVRGRLSTWRVPTQILSINPRWLGAVPQIDELLVLLGNRLQVLDLYGDLGALSTDRCCVRADLFDIRLPMLKELHFDNAGPLELSVLLNLARSTLVTLKVEFRFAFGVLENLDRTPIQSLRNLHITHPNIDFLTRYALCGIGVNMEMLELHIYGKEIQETVGLLKELPSTMKKLELHVKTWRVIDDSTKAAMVQPIRDIVAGKWDVVYIFHA
ncbi:hypothetical protein FRC02_000764 [Tulasnella sp. 418]|nr:hypothetical protein FRC02_000764 [Tulasnella sp. 418]